MLNICDIKLSFVYFDDINCFPIMKLSLKSQSVKLIEQTPLSAETFP